MMVLRPVDGATLAWRSGASGPAGHRDAFEGVHTGKGFDWHFQKGYAEWRGIEMMKGGFIMVEGEIIEC